MKQLDQYEAMSVGGATTDSGSPVLAGIGMPVDSLPMPICPAAIPELF